MARASGQPLLAYGNRGLGRAGVFASDLAGAAGRELRRAEAFPAWLSQWVTEVGRPRPQLPRDRLVETRVMPPAPTPPEQALLLAGTAPGAELRPLDGFELPPRRHELEFHSHAPDWAIAALVALLLLAMVEWWATRCWLPGSGRSPTPDGRS